MSGGRHVPSGADLAILGAHLTGSWLTLAYFLYHIVEACFHISRTQSTASITSLGLTLAQTR